MRCAEAGPPAGTLLTHFSQRYPSVPTPPGAAQPSAGSADGAGPAGDAQAPGESAALAAGGCSGGAAMGAIGPASGEDGEWSRALFGFDGLCLPLCPGGALQARHSRPPPRAPARHQRAPPPRTKRTRLVLPPVLSGHVKSYMRLPSLGLVSEAGLCRDGVTRAAWPRQCATGGVCMQRCAAREAPQSDGEPPHRRGGRRPGRAGLTRSASGLL
mgnify:CR=1 FL=1|jgi:NAD-dependent dihydropyrimidine dehydrogenase PreA subunit